MKTLNRNDDYLTRITGSIIFCFRVTNLLPVLALIRILIPVTLYGQNLSFPWLANPIQEKETICKRVYLPPEFERFDYPNNSFGDWLRHLPIKNGRPPVYLFDGSKKKNQSAHYAVVNIDRGKTDLQQCADAVMRLRAEYLYSHQQYDKIHFNFTSGDRCEFQSWSEGIRPTINGNKVSWKKSAVPDSSYHCFRRYLNTIFTYAGSYSLQKELIHVKNPEDVQIGDIFIQGGFPGHAVIIVDLAENKSTGQKIFLLAQSYMPAQDIHILKNPEDQTLSPWYPVKSSGSLITPEWDFTWNDLYRFPE